MYTSNPQVHPRKPIQHGACLPTQEAQQSGSTSCSGNSQNDTIGTSTKPHGLEGVVIENWIDG